MSAVQHPAKPNTHHEIGFSSRTLTHVQCQCWAWGSYKPYLLFINKTLSSCHKSSQNNYRTYFFPFYLAWWMLSGKSATIISWLLFGEFTLAQVAGGRWPYNSQQLLMLMVLMPPSMAHYSFLLPEWNNGWRTLHRPPKSHQLYPALSSSGRVKWTHTTPSRTNKVNKRPLLPSCLTGLPDNFWVLSGGEKMG